MTIEQWAEKYLTDNGLWPDEATAVMASAKANQANESMERRWNDDTEAYPPQLLALLRVSLDTEAVEYIDANCPQHFARMMFAPSDPDTHADALDLQGEQQEFDDNRDDYDWGSPK